MLKGLCVSILCLFGLASVAAGQKTLSVRGSVVDPAGAAVSGASVWIETPDGTVVAKTQTDAKGYFALPNLSSGTLSIVVPAYLGFAQKVAPLRLTIARSEEHTSEL